MSPRAPLIMLGLLLITSLSGFSPDGVLPQTLREDAQRRGCSEIADFYDRPARIDPAYVFGYIESRTDEFGENSAVYWCQVPTGAERYRLVVWIGDSSLSSSFTCPRTIAWKNYPGGLRLVRSEHSPLRDFWYREDPTRKGPADGVTDGTIIESEYDGISARFFCRAGKWLVQQLD